MLLRDFHLQTCLLQNPGQREEFRFGGHQHRNAVAGQLASTNDLSHMRFLRVGIGGYEQERREAFGLNGSCLIQECSLLAGIPQQRGGELRDIRAAAISAQEGEVASTQSQGPKDVGVVAPFLVQLLLGIHADGDMRRNSTEYLEGVLRQILALVYEHCIVQRATDDLGKELRKFLLRRAPLLAAVVLQQILLHRGSFRHIPRLQD